MTRRKSDGGLSRRRFLAGSAAAALGSFMIMPGRVLGAPAAPAAPRGVGVCGLGRGMSFLGGAIAVVDVDRTRMEEGVKRIGGKKGYSDFREMLDRKDIDLVRVLTPPHWHALMSIMAMRSGKDVFCEKPLTRTIAEGKAVVEAVKRFGIKFTYGAHTETPNWQLMRKVAVSGILGTPLTFYVRGGNLKVPAWTGMINQRAQAIPPTLDWDMYCGPSPLKPYHPHRTHMSFRGYWDYDGGGLTDMVPHVFNEFLNNIGKDDTSPCEVETIAPPAHDDAVGIFYYSRLKWADGTTLLVDAGCGGPPDGADPKIFIEGPNGKIMYQGQGGGDRRAMVSDPPGIMDDLKNMPDPPSPSRLIGLPQSVATVTHAHRTNCLGILINLSLRVGRKLRFDPVKEEVIGDEEASRLACPTMRAPWRIC